MLSCLSESPKQYPRQRDISMRHKVDAMGDFQIYRADWTIVTAGSGRGEEMASIDPLSYR